MRRINDFGCDKKLFLISNYRMYNFIEVPYKYEHEQMIAMFGGRSEYFNYFYIHSRITELFLEEFDLDYMK